MKLKKIKRTLIYLAIRVAVFVFGLFPVCVLGYVGRYVGVLGFWLARKERGKTLRSLRVAFPDRSESKIYRLGKASWANLGRNGFELLGWSCWSHAKVAAQVRRLHGWEHFNAALKDGKGVFGVTAHLGHWELCAAYIGSLTPLAVVYKPLYDPRLDRMVLDFRSKWGGSLIPRGQALKGILRALAENRVIGVLLDQSTRDDQISVPFFGKNAWTPSGPARIAIKTGAAMVPLFLVRGGDGEFELHIEPRIEIPHTGNADADIKETVRRYTEVIERYVRTYPEQWTWMHDRWKTPNRVCKRAEIGVPKTAANRNALHSAPG